MAKKTKKADTTPPPRPRAPAAAQEPAVLRIAQATYIPGMLLLMAITPLVFFKTSGEFDNNSKMALLQWGTGLLALLAVLGAARNREVTWWRTPLDLPIGLFYLGALASLLQAVNPWQATLYLVHWGAAILFFGLIVQRATKPETFSAVFFALTSAVALVCLIGILQKLEVPRTVTSWIPQLIAPASTFSNKNMAAEFTAMVVPMIVATIVLSSRMWMKGVGIISLGLAVVYMLYTETRASWLATLVTALLLGIFVAGTPVLREKALRFVRRKMFLVALAGVCGVVLVAAAITVRQDPAFYSSTKARFVSMWKVQAGSTGHLRIIWRKNALAMVKDHWVLGVGLGNFKLNYPLYHQAVEKDWTFSEARQLNRVHLDHLQMLVELGAVGFACYALMFGVFVWMFQRVYRAGDEQEKLLSLVLFLSVVNIGIVAALCFPWERALPPFLLFMCFGLMAVLDRRRHAAATVIRDSRLQKLVRAGSLVALAVFLAVSFSCIRKVVVSDKYFVQGLTLQERKNYEASSRALEKAKAAFPMWNFNVPTLLARNYTMQGDYRRAIEEYAEALRVHPNNINALMNTGYCYLQLQDFDQAEHYFRRFLDIMPDSAKGLNNLGTVYYNRRDLVRAAELYLQSIAQEPKYVEPHYNLATVYRLAGNIPGAIEAYVRVLEIRPDMQDVRKMLATAYAETGRHDKARETMEPMLQDDATAAAGALLLGDIYQQLGQHQRSLEQFLDAVRLDPKNPSAHHSLGLTHYFLQDYDKAQQSFETALGLNPGGAVTWQLLGQLYLRKQDEESALLLLQKAVELDPGLRDAQFSLGTVCLRLGLLDQAVTAYERAIAIDPSFSLAHYNLATILRHRGDSARALKHFQQALKNPDPLIDQGQAREFIAELQKNLAH